MIDISNKNYDVLFIKVVNLIQSLPKTGPITPSANKRLKFYGFYKMATESKEFIMNKKKPKLYHIEERLKWKHLQSVLYLSQEEAKYLYLKEFGLYLVEIFKSKNVDQLLKTSDLSFMKTLSLQDVELLICEALKYDYVTEKIKTEMLEYFNKNIKQLFNNKNLYTN